MIQFKSYTYLNSFVIIVKIILGFPIQFGLVFLYCIPINMAWCDRSETPLMRVCENLRVS